MMLTTRVLRSMLFRSTVMVLGVLSLSAACMSPTPESYGPGSTGYRYVVLDTPEMALTNVRRSIYPQVLSHVTPGRQTSGLSFYLSGGRGLPGNSFLDEITQVDVDSDGIAFTGALKGPDRGSGQRTLRMQWREIRALNSGFSIGLHPVTLLSSDGDVMVFFSSSASRDRFVRSVEVLLNHIK